MKDCTVFIFRRDLRLPDNKALNFAMKHFDNILPVFIFTPEQISGANKFRSDNAIQFMVESLRDLDGELRKCGSKLHIFNGDNIAILAQINGACPIKNVVFNVDYTPYARSRDAKIATFCKENGINCATAEDYLLANIGAFNKADGTPFLVFTPFKNNGMKRDIERPEKVSPKNLAQNDEFADFDDKRVREIEPRYEENQHIAVHGGRTNGLKMLSLVKNHKNYNADRNSKPTTMLSAYIKFGCVSIREVYWKIMGELGSANELVGQLFWREFYYYIAYYFPDVLHGRNYNARFDKIEWRSSSPDFKKWCAGMTGFPIVDAGMRQLNKTGYMHNRARLITSNFLNRMLGMDWRKGEQYFAKKLTDYDPSVNNGNWQWIASTGVDPKPYFQRLFNPHLQSEKFDADAHYIKTWLPQLAKIPAPHLHNWSEHASKYDLRAIDYVAPMLDYKEARERSVAMYNGKKY